MKTLTILAVMASLAVIAVAQAAPLPPVCKGGILADGVTGKPMLDSAKQPIPCDLPQAQAESGLVDPTLLGVGALAAFGASVGVAASSQGSNQPPPSSFIPPLPASP